MKWTVAAAAGAALAALGALLGRWCADAALGWRIALSASADDDGARAWAAGGALAALGVPALLRFLGLALADPALLEKPLGTHAAFTLGQASLLAAIAAACWTRAARGGGRIAPAAFLAGAAAAFVLLRRVEASTLLAAAALAALSAALTAERPWSRRESAPLRSRLFAAAAAVGALLAACAPRLLPDVWMSRLHTAYPGGNYVTYADDGTDVWAAYRFSTGAATMLRDGVPQSPDPVSVQLSLLALIGQRSARTSLLLVRPPEPAAAFTAQNDDAAVVVEDGSRAEAAALRALGSSADWTKELAPPPGGGKPDAALVFLPRPAGAGLRRLAGASALKALRARLAGGAAAGLLLPPGTAPRAVDAAARSAAAEFGRARVADLPKGVLILASPVEIDVDPDILVGRLSPAARQREPNAREALAEGLRWRSAPPSK
jgi:hypothetical protein